MYKISFVSEIKYYEIIKMDIIKLNIGFIDNCLYCFNSFVLLLFFFFVNVKLLKISER